MVFAWLLRFDFRLPGRQVLLATIPILVVLRLSTMAYFGLLRGWWRYTGTRDVIDVLKAVGTASVLCWFCFSCAPAVFTFPRSICVIEALLTAGLLVGVRLLSRVLAGSMREDMSSSRSVLLIGAGAAAQTILGEISRPGSGYTALGCLDDDQSKIGIRIKDVPVLGTVDDLSRVLRSKPADEVLIAVPSATNIEMRRFVEICNRANINFRTMPALKDVIAGRVTVSQLRDVNLEDLLGRNPVHVDLDAVRREITGRSVLVTGAAGSIGSELCRQILAYSPARLVCLDQAETGLFYLRHELLSDDDPFNKGDAIDRVFSLADVSDGERMRRVFSEFTPEIIFHVALLDLLELAEAGGAKRFVLISSDKAVNPSSVMGASKRICELILSSRPSASMHCVSVRFGNVLGSSGSVIPVLQGQLRNHQPLTITHSEMKRFFMSISEAVALVLQASAIGNRGDILVLDMGDPVRILDLARSLIRLSGKSEGDVEIHFTGLREGEKLEEQLFYAHEEVISTVCPKIKQTKGPVRDWGELSLQLDDLRASITIDGPAPVRAKIKEIVTEYCPPDLAAPLGEKRVLVRAGESSRWAWGEGPASTEPEQYSERIAGAATTT